MNSFPKSISITVLTGFLGSGKTTLSKKLIKKKKHGFVLSTDN